MRAGKFENRFAVRCVAGIAVLSWCLASSTAALAQNEEPPNCAAGFAGPMIASASVSLPKVGEEREVEIGQSAISTFTGNILGGAIDLTQSISLSGKYFGKTYTVDIAHGRYLPSLNDNGWEYYIKDAVFRYGDGKPRKGGSKPDSVLFVNARTGALSARVLLGLKTQEFSLPEQKFLISKCLSLGDSGFRKELLYSGVSKGTVSLEYREFSNNLARPAFSQQVTYDLSEGNEVGFKGARLVIIKAANTLLRYRVIKGLE